MRSIFSKATLPGWVLILASQLRWIYALIDAWSNVEFIREKVSNTPLLAVLAGVLASAWFQIALILVGLAWIALATSGAPQYLRRFWPGRHTAGGETEEEVVYLIPRSLADQIADMQRERRADGFLLVQDDRGTREYSRQEVDNLTPTQREKLFAADPEMPAWWRGRSPRNHEWSFFRVKGGIWISKTQVDHTPEKYRLDIFEGIPGLLDWDTKNREF